MKMTPLPTKKLDLPMLKYITLLYKLAVFKILHPAVPILRGRRLLGRLNSQGGQDYLALPLVMKYFREGIDVVVDVGANHPTKFSNSFFFEKYLGMKTIAIEPLAEYSEIWRELRPRAKFIAKAASDREGVADIFVPSSSDDMFSSLSATDSKVRVEPSGWSAMRVVTDTVTNICKSEGVSKIALLTIDVEGHEEEVLQGINFNQLDIKVILIENNEDRYFGSEKIRRALAAQGYRYVMRIGALDDLFEKRRNL